MSNSLKQQLNGLSHLLLLQSRALQATDLSQLAFVLVNDTRQLLTYDSALFFHYKPGKKTKSGKIKAISDVGSFDARGEYAIAHLQLCKACDTMCGDQSRILTLDELEQAGYQLDKKHFSNHANLLWLPLALTLKHKEANTEHSVGGLLLMRQAVWGEQELNVLAHWQKGINHALVNLYAQSKLISRIWYNKSRRTLLWLLFLILPIILSIPVPLTVIAPAEVIPLQPEVVRAPLAGVISTLDVSPNQSVVAGQPLLTLDNRELKTELQVVEQAKVIAQAELDQAQQAALFDAKAKAALPLLKMRLQQQQAEYNYTAELLARTEIKANDDGIAIISNENDMIGRPVAIGERLLILAQLDKKELQIWLAVNDEIPLETGDKVVFYPETNPDIKVQASIDHIAYQAAETPDAGLAYRLSATIQSPDMIKALRIGMRGSARIYNQKVSLFYYLFHKPLSSLRLWFGF